MEQYHLRITGSLCLVVALIHLGFPSRFEWRKQLSQLTLINRQMMIVHTFFVALTVFLIGLLCLFYPGQLLLTPLGRVISGGLFVFWGLRLVVQFFVYSPALWRGKPFETMMHVIFSGIWAYFTLVFFFAAMGR